MKTNWLGSGVPERWNTSQKVICFFALVLVFTCGFAIAQTGSQATWRGVLRNAGGAPIADAKITLTSGEAKAEAHTDSNGRFQTGLLPAGSYHLTVASNGSTAEMSQPISVEMGSPEALLTLSGRGELTATAAASGTQTGSGGQELSSQAVSELPLNKRDFSTLLLLAAAP